MDQRSLSARRAWIEIPAGCWRDARRVSLSARRAWIEISVTRYRPTPKPVALRKESVDRNRPAAGFRSMLGVALRKESVDRNTQRRDFKSLGLVALRKESVDRNCPGTNTISSTTGRSPQGERG